VIGAVLLIVIISAGLLCWVINNADRSYRAAQLISATRGHDMSWNGKPSHGREGLRGPSCANKIDPGASPMTGDLHDLPAQGLEQEVRCWGRMAGCAGLRQPPNSGMLTGEETGQSAELRKCDLNNPWRTGQIVRVCS
jgi:hypothetical protein